jgi:hypothetical protein
MQIHGLAMQETGICHNAYLYFLIQATCAEMWNQINTKAAQGVAYATDVYVEN